MAEATDAPPDVIALGEEARGILESPLLALAAQRVADKLLNAFKNSAPGATAQREEAYRLWWALEALRGELNAMVGAAKVKAARRQ